MYETNKVTQLLLEILGLQNFCEKRLLEKMKATDNGFGDYNRIESFSFDSDGVGIIVEDKGYDIRDTSYEKIYINEICMTEEEWKNRLKEMRTERNQVIKKEKDRQKNEESFRKEKLFYELKKELKIK